MNAQVRDTLKIPFESLQRITEIDPLYKPAQFFLAYTRLRVGQAEKAAEMFASLTAPVNQEAEMIYQSVKEKWPRTGLRGLSLLSLSLVKPFTRRYILPWLKLWDEITESLIGGEIFRQAKQWSEFEDRFTKWKNKNPKNEAFEEALFQVYVHSFTERYDIRNYVRLAAGLEAGKDPPERYRETLDIVLEEDNLWQFNHEIGSLLSEIPFIEFDEAIRETVKSEPRPDRLPAVRQLRQHPVSILYKGGLEKIEKAWEAEDWETCKKFLGIIDRETSGPRESITPTLLLRALKLPPSSGRLIRFFLPAYTLLDKWQATFQHAFFLESEYYFALAWYNAWTRPGLVQALEHAFALHDRWLVGQPPADMDPRRHAELRLLAQCLEADAAVRIALSEEPDPDYSKNSAEVRLNEIFKGELVEKLRQKAGDLGTAPNVRAAALNTLGLLGRYRSKVWYLRDESEESEDELGLFFRSLNLMRSADTCLLIAETLVERQRPTEARRYLKEALRLSPQHCGSKTLLEKMPQ